MTIIDSMLFIRLVITRWSDVFPDLKNLEIECFWTVGQGIRMQGTGRLLRINAINTESDSNIINRVRDKLDYLI